MTQSLIGRRVETIETNIEYHKQGKVIQLSGGEPKLKCAICNKKIEDSLGDRVTVTVGETSCVPKTWGICFKCFKNRGK